MTTTGQGRRRYDARSRQMQARESRERVLAVAGRLFVEHGYAGTSIAWIAQEAGVSTPTVFAGFRSKVNLLKAVVDTAIAGDTEDRIHEAKTFAEVVVRMTDAFAEVAERAYPIYAVLHGAADSDPQIAALLHELDRQRLLGAGMLAATLTDRLGYGDVEEIRDALYVLRSPLQYGLIVHDLGRPLSWYRSWVARQLRALG